jgi:hypothetical protein
LIPSLQHLTQNNIKTLRIFADEKYERAEQDECLDIDDLKIKLTRAQLIAKIGSQAVEELELTFGHRYDEILVRRC